ncbi:unnamed protein product [Cyclocybe aegerita]|uniref:Ribosomal L1 domain-containing protein 1 n=1 Tax=Cyclocybe aegerita TaxID=1973307 RepID=A0A8S0VS14_CYCAE|nr:unnamed protein product [Cyclocybe aegerita]
MSEGDQLIDSHVSLKQCQKAVEALHSHELKQKEKFEENQLLPAKEQHIWLNVTVKKIVARHRLKPYKIPISHPIVDPRTTPVCLITKDPQREYKDLLEKHNIKFISRVVGIEKLKGKFKPFEARRMLLKENGMFLADERVIPLLPKLLGTKWFEAKKQPIPVCLTRKDLKGELERAISSTYMNQNQGTCTSIKVGKMSQKPSQIVQNVQTALPAIAKAVQGGWDNIQSFHIKTNASMSLPIWSCSLDDAEGGRWDGLKAGDEDDEEDDSDEEDESKAVESSKSKKATPSKGRKRPSSSDEEEEEEEKPKKKAKGPDGASKTKESAKSGSKVASARVDSTATPSKKRKADEQPSTSSKPEVSASSGKKGKPTAGKKKDAAQATTQPTDAGVEALSKKKKSGSKGSDDTASPKKSAPSSGPASTTTPSGEESGKSKEKEKRQKEKSSKAGDAVVSSVSEKTAATPSVSLSKEEVKQKRSAGAGEKKKEIIAKSKGGKSVKNAVLGKKAAQV